MDCLPAGKKLDFKLTSDQADGSHSIEISIKDKTGNESNKLSHSFTIDTTPPILSFVSPPTATYYSPTSSCYNTTFSWTADSSDIEKYYYKLDDSEYLETTTKSVTLCTKAGSRNLKIYAKDTAGNSSMEIAHTWNVLGRFSIETIGGEVVARNLETKIMITTSRPAGKSISNLCKNLTYAGHSDWTIASYSVLSGFSLNNFSNSATSDFKTTTLHSTGSTAGSTSKSGPYNSTIYYYYDSAIRLSGDLTDSKIIYRIIQGGYYVNQYAGWQSGSDHTYDVPYYCARSF